MKNENYSFYDVCEAGTIKELMLTNEEEFENYTAIKYTKRRKAIDVTYAELKEEIDSLGTYLYARDMRNFKIAILGNNSYEWVLSFLTIITGNNIIAGVIAPMVQRTIILLDPDNKRIMEDFRIFQPDSIIVVPSIIEELNRVLWDRDEEEVRWLKKKVKRTLFLLSHGVDLRKKLSRYTFDIFGGCLKYIICGGSPLEENYINTFRAFGIEILNGYGLTECSAVVSVNRNEFNFQWKNISSKELENKLMNMKVVK